jgi:hypothetical protein
MADEDADLLKRFRNYRSTTTMTTTRSCWTPLTARYGVLTRSWPAVAGTV